MSETRTAFITGASSGVGAATAVAFAALGWRVAIGARRDDRLAEVAATAGAAGGKVFTHPLDVAKAESIESFFDAAESALGPVDVLVSNAGIGLPSLLHEATVEQLQSEVAVN